MARKNTLQYQLLTTQSLSANFTSPVTSITYLDNLSYQINVTTTNSTGTFTIQGSTDYEISLPTSTVINPGNWCDLPLASTAGVASPTVAAANDVIIVDMNQLPFVAIRIKYTSGTAGTGTVDIWISAKQIGG